MPHELETTVARAWIAAVLLNDSVISGKLAKRVYAGIATPQAGDFYIVYSFVSPRLTKKLGQRRAVIRLLYDIRVYQKGSGNSDFTTVVNRVDEIFSGSVNVKYKNTWNISSELDAPLDLPENDKDKDTQWSCLGGTYKISIYKL